MAIARLSPAASLVKVVVLVACAVLAAPSVAEARVRHEVPAGDEQRMPARPEPRPDAEERLAAGADDAPSWWRRMLAAEGRYAFDEPSQERASLPMPDPSDAPFNWPVGASPERVAAAFDMTIEGRERVAGLTAVVLRVEPRHDGLLWRFWIDIDTGARIGYRATLPSGRVVAEGWAVGPPRPVESPERRLLAPREPPREQAERWREAFGGLPGFEPLEVSRIALEPGVPALRVTLWDGLSGVVLVVFPERARRPDREFVAVREVGALTLALVGPVEPTTARRFLAALATRPWAQGDWDDLVRALSAP